MKKNLPIVQISDEEFDFLYKEIKSQIRQEIENNTDDYGFGYCEVAGEEVSIEVSYNFDTEREEETYELPATTKTTVSVNVIKVVDDERKECRLDDDIISMIEDITIL